MRAAQAPRTIAVGRAAAFTARLTGFAAPGDEAMPFATRAAFGRRGEARRLRHGVKADAGLRALRGLSGRRGPGMLHSHR